MKWTAAFINDLPDSSFAYIEPGGEKDAEGKTTPRSKRHLPYKDKDGKVDLPHLRNALARLEQTDISAEAKAAARKKLHAAAKSAGVEVAKEGALSLEQRQVAIRAAVEETLGPAWNDGESHWSIVATFDDAVIVDQGGKLARFPVAFDLFGVAQAGTPEPVEMVYRTLKEARGSVLLGPLAEAEGSSARPGSRWAVVVIQEGLSANRTLYPGDVLRKAAPLYEGSKVFWNHVRDAEALRDPRDIAGFLRAPKAAQLGEGGNTAVLATLHVTTQAARERLLEAHEAGNPELYGLSHAALAEYERVRHTDGHAAMKVTAIKAVESVDIVSFPSAGGRVLRLVAGLASPVEATEEELVMLEKKLARLKEARPDLYAKLGPTPTEAEVDALLLEAVTPKPAAPPEPKPPTPPPPPGPTPDAAGGLSQADRALLHEARVERVMRGREFGPLADLARETLTLKADAGEEELGRVADSFVARAAKLVEQIGGSGQGTTIEAVKDEAEKLIGRLDAFFSPKEDLKVRESFKAIYIDMTGDRHLTGQLHEAKGLSRFARARITEAITSSTFAELLGDSIRRAMVADYRTITYLDDWRRVVSSVVPLSDFRTNRRPRLGGYGDLPTVAEAGTYTALTSPTDEEATYALGKKGGKETISLETIANDDVGAIAQIPRRLSRAAKRTLYKAVFDTMGNNGNIYDGAALAVAGHNNLGATALSSTTLAAARLAMNKQAAYGAAADLLALDPRFLIVPPDLRTIAEPLILSPVLPLAAANATEPNYLRNSGLRELVVVPYWSDANNWWVIADPADVPTIEVGFYQGRQEPELFVADLPNAGALFSNDQLEYKIRFIFGLAVIDFRGFYGAIVA